jgi:hypothetical protein
MVGRSVIESYIPDENEIDTIKAACKGRFAIHVSKPDLYMIAVLRIGGLSF